MTSESREAHHHGARPQGVLEADPTDAFRSARWR